VTNTRPCSSLPQVKEMIEKDGITGIEKVMGISKLRDRFKQFEQKRQLSNSFDLFLTDEVCAPHTTAAAEEKRDTHPMLPLTHSLTTLRSPLGHLPSPASSARESLLPEKEAAYPCQLQNRRETGESPPEGEGLHLLLCWLGLVDRYQSRPDRLLLQGDRCEHR